MGTIAKRISEAILSWPGVTSEPHRFGGVEFKLGRRESGALHGDRLPAFPFPRPVREQLVSSGRAEPHHVLPDSGWVTRRIRSEADVADVIELFRLNYDRKPAG